MKTMDIRVPGVMPPDDLIHFVQTLMAVGRRIGKPEWPDRLLVTFGQYRELARLVYEPPYLSSRGSDGSLRFCGMEVVTSRDSRPMPSQFRDEK